MIDLEQRCLLQNFGTKCKVAVDGAASTVIDVVGPNPGSIGLRPKVNPLDSNYNGYLFKYYVQPSVEAYSYFSPNGLLSNTDTVITYEIFDINAPEWVLATFDVKKYKVPVLMVHGLNSNGATWDNVENFLIANGYNPNHLIAPDVPNDQSFAINYPYVLAYIQVLLQTQRNQGINVNQVDVVGHSMGGLLGRYYLQSIEYDTRQNINKLITINTPHAGSELANFVYDGMWDSAGVWLAEKLGININGGAMADLRVNSIAIENMNSSIEIDKSRRAPIHTISTDFTGCDVLVATSLLGTLGYAGSLFFDFGKHSLCGIGCLYDCFLGGEHDGVVRVFSQKGGLAVPYNSHYAGISGTGHTFSLGNTTVHNQLLTLLTVPTSSSLFTANGFNPISLPPPSLKSEDLAENSVIDISIQNLNNNDTIYASDTPALNILGTPSVTGILVAYIYENGFIEYDSNFLNSCNFSIKIPFGYSGKIDIGVLGTDGFGTVDFESIRVHVVEEICPDNFTITVNPANMDEISAFNSLNTLGNVSILNSSNVVFKAGSSIMLAPGFQVEIGSSLSISIEQCDN
jgi:pimeloyl-ACP methyl ester carboxylesterase